MSGSANVVYPAGYYSRFNPAQHYEQWLFRAGYVLQGAEENEIQQLQKDRLKRVADALFASGAVISGCALIVNPTTGATTISAGVLYIAGAMRDIAAASLTIPVTGTVAIGAYLQYSVVTELQDPTLLDPAVGVRNYQQPGAERLQVVAVWGVAGGGTAGDFYPVFSVVNGTPTSQQPPPQIDGVALAIARYDQEATGGYYISSGLTVTALPNDSSGNQIYSIASGVARINGAEVLIKHALRVVYAAAPNLATVLAEPHVALGGTETVTLNHGPVTGINQVLINTQVVSTISHGTYSGVSDPLPDSPVISITAVNQGGVWNGTNFVGGTNFTSPADYTLVNDELNWSSAAAQPAPGSTYQVAYIYIASVTPTAVTNTGFSVSGAVAGSVTQVSYNWAMPRIDLLTLDGNGLPNWIIGVANPYTPIAPATPPGLLELANVYQTWITGTQLVTNDGTRMMPTYQIDAMANQITTLFDAVSSLELTVATTVSDPTTKLGIFVDNFVDSTKRDAGISQTAAIYTGILTLPMTGVQVSYCGLPAPAMLPLNTAATAPVIQQLLITACQQINPYMSFTPFPASASLVPACDFWTATVDVWLDDITERFVESQTDYTAYGGWEWWAPLRYIGSSTQLLVSEHNQLVSNTTLAAQYMRQLSVSFTLKGFGPGENLSTVTFGGIAVTPASAVTANSSGVAIGSFTIPANVPAGSALVTFTGAGGSTAFATYVGRGQITTQELREVTDVTAVTTTVWEHIDPIAETFSLSTATLISGVDVWICAVGTSGKTFVQIKEVSNGVPTTVVLTGQMVETTSLVNNQWNRFTWPPIRLDANTMYAIVVGCDDAVTACSVATLGQFAANAQQWVTQQPYQVGVFLSSSNASTWTPAQNTDLTFRLLNTPIAQTTATIALPSFTVTGATELIVLAAVELPTSDCQCVFNLTLPSGVIIQTPAGAHVVLPAVTTGTIQFSMTLTGSASATPLVQEDIAVAWGSRLSPANYVARALPAGTGTTIAVYFEALLPGTAALAVNVSPDGLTGWTSVPFVSATQIGAGWVDTVYRLVGTWNSPFAHVELVLTGDSLDRPQVRKLRVVVT